MSAPRWLVKLMLASLLGTLSACEWTGRTFTTSVVVPVKTTAQSPLCTTSRVAVNLEDQKTYREVKGIVGRLRVDGVSLSLSEPEVPQPGSQATTLRGRVSLLADENATGAPVIDFDALDLSSTFEAKTEGTSDDPIENLITRPSADAAGAVAFKAKGRFLLEVATCADANPADLLLLTDLTFYLEL